tara:strand:- start:60 stop:296 length:237 start_codon:yes stop_codon:yes gene_type:complete
LGNATTISGPERKAPKVRATTSTMVKKMSDKYLIKRIIALALKIKDTESLSEVAEELRTMELEKMFTTKEGKYYKLNT